MSNTDRKQQKDHFLRTVVVIVLTLVVCVVSGRAFVDMRLRQAPIYPGEGVTSVGKLGDYLPNLRGTAGDADVYFLDSGNPGATVVVLGGTHPDEPSGYVAATVLVENAIPSTGRVIVVPQVNRSGFTHNTPLEGFPSRFTIDTPNGERWFQFGSRLASPLDQWPDPDVYLHYPSGQKMSGEETRNLNRSFPGRPDGVYIERVAHAVVTLVEEEDADIVIDLHEAPLEYFFIDAIAAHPKGIEVAVITSLELSMDDIVLGMESAPSNLRGFTHNEIGNKTSAMTFLMETANPMMGRLRGRTDEALIIDGKDEAQVMADKLGRTFVDYDEDGIPLKLRVARHVTGISKICSVFSEIADEKKIEFDYVPEYDDIMEHGLGAFLSPPA